MRKIINFNKNRLINDVLVNYYETFARTLDTADFVPEKFNDKILQYIFKNMKKSFKKIDKQDKIFQREFKRTQVEKIKSINLKRKQQNKINRQLKRQERKEKMKVFFSRLFITKNK